MLHATFQAAGLTGPGPEDVSGNNRHDDAESSLRVGEVIKSNTEDEERR